MIKINTYVKSPLNYTGGKFKLLPQIIPLFPKNINTFIDLFCGGGNIGVNVEAKNIICNDIQSEVIDFLDNCKKYNSSEMIILLKQTIDKYKLSKTNQEGFLQIRKDYNSGQREWNMFFAMVTNAFNYQIRFNSKKEFNMPFGKDRSSFNPSLEKNFIDFIDKIHTKKIVFINKSFLSLKINELKSNDFVYCDPPYLITDASYNENGGWSIENEKELLNLLDNLHKQNIKFALSNVLEHKGRENTLLKEWSEKYNINYLNYNYSNCNYQTKDKDKNSSIEVLITNY